MLCNFVGLGRGISEDGGLYVHSDRRGRPSDRERGVVRKGREKCRNLAYARVIALIQTA